MCHISISLKSCLNEKFQIQINMSGCSSDLAKMNELRETHKQWSPVGSSEVNFLEPHNQSEA